MPETVTRAIARALVESGQVPEMAQRIKRRLGWRCTDRHAHQLLDRMLAGGYSDTRHLPADVILDAIELTGLDYVTPLIAEALERGELAAAKRRVAALEDELARTRVRAVRRERREGRKAGQGRAGI